MNKIRWYLPIIIFGFIFLFYSFFTYMRFSCALQKIDLEKGILLVNYSSPKKSYGSGNTIISFYTKYFLKMGEIKLGEFPVSVKEMKKTAIEIRIQLINYTTERIEYVEKWIEGKNKIGSYSIEYVIEPKPVPLQKS